MYCTKLVIRLSGYDYNASSTVIRNGTSYCNNFRSLDTVKAVVPFGICIEQAP